MHRRQGLGIETGGFGVSGDWRPVELLELSGININPQVEKLFDSNSHIFSSTSFHLLDILIHSFTFSLRSVLLRLIYQFWLH
jgi:hypothetical protein